MTSKIWMIDEPSPFADRAEWEAYVAGLRRLEAKEPHPDLRAAIARAEKALAELETTPETPVRKAV